MLRILWRIVRYALRHKLLVTVAYGAMAGSIVALLIIPRLVGSAIDTALEGGSRTDLLLQAGAIVAMAAVQGVLRYIDEYTSEIVVQRVGREIRTDIFQKLQSLSYGFHDRQRTGDLMSRATADVDSVRVFPIWGLGEFGFMVILVGTASVLMLTMNLVLGLATMGFMALVIWRSAADVPVMVGLHRQGQEAIGRTATVVQEALTGIRVVKAFGGQALERAKFDEPATDARDYGTAASKISVTRGALSALVMNASIITVISLGRTRCCRGGSRPGRWRRSCCTWVSWRGPFAWQVSRSYRRRAPGHRASASSTYSMPNHRSRSAGAQRPCRGRTATCVSSASSSATTTGSRPCTA